MRNLTHLAALALASRHTSETAAAVSIEPGIDKLEAYPTRSVSDSAIF